MRTYSKLACFIFYCLAVFMLWTTAGIVSAATITGYGAKCLDIRSGEIRDGADVQIYTCHGGPNQKSCSQR